MSKKKRERKRKKIEAAMSIKVAPKKKFEDYPALEGVIHPENWNFINAVNIGTGKHLGDMWKQNIVTNIKNGMWEKHKALVDDCIGLGKNKATIGIGAGASFNINRYVLRDYLLKDGVRDWEYRSFVTICSNHQFKPCLEIGIVPDFVLLVDGSDVTYKQLCEDIPKSGQNTILLTGLHCSPKVLNAWTEQGRSVRFFLNAAEDALKEFGKLVNKDPNKYTMELGGNVLNGAWAISISKMQSYCFMAVGNDLSFKIEDDIDKQRTGFYADKDYSTNAKETGTGRDEGGKDKRWAGFHLEPSLILNAKGIDRYNITLDIVGTSHTLWVYKCWLETQLMNQTVNKNTSFHYFNCSEAGILGVMSRERPDHPDFNKASNWYMLDEKCRFYHTAILKDALDHFEKCKELFICQQRGSLGVLPATRSAVLH